MAPSKRKPTRKQSAVALFRQSLLASQGHILGALERINLRMAKADLAEPQRPAGRLLAVSGRRVESAAYKPHATRVTANYIRKEFHTPEGLMGHVYIPLTKQHQDHYIRFTP